jgi:hypothetical protein
MSIAFAVVVAGGTTPPGYLLPAGHVIVRPPVASCFATIVPAHILVAGGTPVGEMVVFPVSVRSQKLESTQLRVYVPVTAVFETSDSV